MFFIIQNVLFNLIDLNNSQNASLYQSLEDLLQINSKVVTVLFVFFCLFIFCSGLVVFPIVIGV